MTLQSEVSLPRINQSHDWTFIRSGGILQAQIKTVADLRNLEHLDPKVWVALSCPVDNLEIDRETLELIDQDGDGRVRIEELIAAVNWTLERVSDPKTLFQNEPLQIDAIDRSNSNGKKIAASALRILKNLKQSDRGSIDVATASDTDLIFGNSKLNGDGVVALEAVNDEATRELVIDIIKCFGATKDRSGKEGVRKEDVEAFFGGLHEYLDWWEIGKQNIGDNVEILPLGENTPAAYSIYQDVHAKIEDYFARCQLVAFDPRAEAALNRDPDKYTEIADNDLSESRPDINALPLAMVTNECILPEVESINPEWKDSIAKFYREVLQKLFPETGSTMTLEQWSKVKAEFDPYSDWLDSKPDTPISQLKVQKIKNYLESDQRGELEELLSLDAELAPEMKAIDDVAKLARFQRDLVTVLNNYVNFSQFYDRSRTAIFQAGQLFLDGRECLLCLRVDDPAKHSVLATLSRAFVAYCECRRKDHPERFYIAAVFTAGDSANLIVGRNGIFRDRRGQLWDTTVVRLIENPISLKEAFFKPYLRLGRFIGDRIEQWANSRDKAMQKQMETGIEKGVLAESNGETPNQKTPGGIAAILAAGGIALGAMGAGLSSLLRTFKALSYWEIPLVVVAVILLISMPSVVIAFVKLRKRTLAPLLDASGWAVNGRTLISTALGRSLTLSASFPPDAGIPRAKVKKFRSSAIWILIGILAVVACASLGYFLWP